MRHFLWAPLIAFVITWLITWWIIRSKLSWFAVDRPNERSLHQAPMPRSGGLGLHAGVLSAMAVISPGLPAALWLAFALLFVISFVDDLRGVPALMRFLIHIAAAGVFAGSLLLEDYGAYAVAAVALAATWMANLYNFMDGSDGLAGGMAAIGFFFYGAAAWLAGSTGFALVNFSIAAAASAFLMFNFHPARIFMGDMGSIPLGFLAAALGVIGWLQQDWGWWFPLLVFSPFIVDASVTLARRLFKWEYVWHAHRDHYYQRLVQMGWGHRNTALAEYALMTACGLLGLVLLPAAQFLQTAGLSLAALGYAALILVQERSWRVYTRANAP